MLIKIEGIIDTEETYVNVHEFMENFIDFIDAHGWTYGGKCFECDEFGEE